MLTTLCVLAAGAEIPIPLWLRSARRHFSEVVFFFPTTTSFRFWPQSEIDKSNTSGYAEDITETQKYANPERANRGSFPFPHTTLLGERKTFKRAANRGRKYSWATSSRTYHLRSSDSARVLRSRSVADKSPSDAMQTQRERAVKKPTGDPVDTPLKPTAKRIRRKKTTESGPDDELLKIPKGIRYFLNRINFQQSFLQVYESEGWKNQRFATSLFTFHL